MLSRIQPYPGQPLRWQQPAAMQRSFVLRDETQQFATLTFPSFLRSTAQVTSAEGGWIFQRRGFFGRTVQILAAHSEAVLASYQSAWSGTRGTLELPGGQRYAWQTLNFWATRYQFRTDAGQPLVTFSTGTGDGLMANIFKQQALVEIDPGAVGLRDLPLLVTLGFYLSVLHRQDSAAAAA